MKKSILLLITGALLITGILITGCEDKENPAPDDNWTEIPDDPRGTIESNISTYYPLTIYVINDHRNIPFDIL